MNEANAWKREHAGVWVRTVHCRANHLQWHSGTCLLLRQEAMTLRWEMSGKQQAEQKSLPVIQKKKRDEECWVRVQAVILTPEELFLMLFTVFQSKQHDLHKKNITWPQNIFA